MQVMEQIRESHVLEQQHDMPASHVNVGNGERIVSAAGGAILAVLGLTRRTVPGILMSAVGAMMIHRGATGRCAGYKLLGINTARKDVDQELAENGIHVEESVLIDKPADALYAFWRQFSNLPRIMRYLERVDVIDDRRSHWVAKVPKLVGGTAEWDAQITADEPGRRIAWRSIEGSQIATVGEVRFEQAPGDRGTVVHVSLEYLPPAGKLGHWAATMLGRSPQQEIRRDLAHFKRQMECGEVVTTEGQSHGTCMGWSWRRR